MALTGSAATMPGASSAEIADSGSGVLGDSGGADAVESLRTRRRRSGSSASSRPTQTWCLRIVGLATTEIIGSAKICSGLTWQQLAGRLKRSA